MLAKEHLSETFGLLSSVVWAMPFSNRPHAKKKRNRVGKSCAPKSARVHMSAGGGVRKIAPNYENSRLTKAHLSEFYFCEKNGR